MSLLFPADYVVRSKDGWTQRGQVTVSATNGRLAKLLAIERIKQLCGVLPEKLELGKPY